MGLLEPAGVGRIAIVADGHGELLGRQHVVGIVDPAGVGRDLLVLAAVFVHGPMLADTLWAMRAVPSLALVALAVVAAGCGKAEQREEAPRPADVVLTPDAAREARARGAGDESAARSRARAVELRGVGAGQERSGGSTEDAPSPGAATDDEVRAELRAARAALANFKRHLASSAFLQTGPRARVLPDGTAVAPDNAPEVVKRVILAANEISTFPYKWGGGHGAWRDTGYDCSGSVSFALAGAGLLRRPLTSGLFMNWAAPGPGRWITIYANPGHMFMVVAGLRFDTSGRGRAGTRWQAEARSTAGMVARHIPGL